jgi:hypothetical protein
MRDIDKESFRIDGRVFLFGLSTLSSLGIDIFSVDQQEKQKSLWTSICSGRSRKGNWAEHVQRQYNGNTLLYQCLEC